MAMGAEDGSFSKIPPEILSDILKFLSPEDLMACSLVCRYLNSAASDEYLWYRLYDMRWGPCHSSKKFSSECAWKKLYIQYEKEDMIKIFWYCPPECKEYYVQMHKAMRSQPPLPS